MDAIEQFILSGLPLVAPFRIVPVDVSGTIGQDARNILDSPPFPKGFSRKRVTESVAVSPRHRSKLENSGHRALRAFDETAH